MQKTCVSAKLCFMNVSWGFCKKVTFV